MSAQDIITNYINFFEKRGHKRISNSPLVPDVSGTLLTTAGMQPLIPYLLGQPHPLGKRLVNIQRCLRTDDIGEVGDTTHHTFYEMLGNWSLGDYWKEEAIGWSFDFLTKELKLPLNLLAVTVFEGDKDMPRDNESIEIWKKVGIPENKIFTRPKKDNWWGPVGNIGPCGPDTEMFIWTGDGDPESVPNENPNWVELWNDVFMQYNKKADGSFEQLKQRNVDTGMGYERILTILQEKQSSYETDLFYDLYQELKKEIQFEVNDTREKRIRIFLDHARASIFLINDGVLPGKNEREAILRRLIRTATDQLTILLNDVDHIKTYEWWEKSFNHFEKIYSNRYQFNENILNVIKDELINYGEIVHGKTKIVENQISSNEDNEKNLIESHLFKAIPGTTVESFMSKNSLASLASVAAGTVAFNAKSTQGFPVEQTFRIAEKKLGRQFDRTEAEKTLKLWQTEHQTISRVSANKKFAGGLADHSEQTIRGHTATHLLHQAIRDSLGNQVHQSGSNITAERIRFDFNFDRNLTPEEISELEQEVNEKIRENLPVKFEIMSLDQAKEIGAIGLFDEKYSDKVKVYTIGEADKPYSVEFCGGPHVDWTREVKSFKIIKQENIGNGLRRLYARVG